jgi:uncharacterized protein (TIGR03435 family)
VTAYTEVVVGQLFARIADSKLRRGLLVATVAFAQPQSVTRTPRPTFEVASIKPCLNPSAGEPRSATPGRLNLNCRNVKDLIRRAYFIFASGKRETSETIAKLTRQPIEGGPAWANTATYTIAAKAESAASREMMNGPMLQVLLEERFKLKFHRETREVPVYVLTVAKGGPKLQATKEGSCTPIDPDNLPRSWPKPGQPPPCGPFQGANGVIVTHGQTMEGLALQFSVALGRNVIDKTGIAGRFDIHLDLTMRDLFHGLIREPQPNDPPEPDTPPDPLGAISNAVRRLGLELKSTNGPEEFIVIDQVERPSEN